MSATCDDLDRPDYLHFDLDPGPDATFQQVLESALAARSSFSELKIPSYPKTSGSRGIHIYVPIRRGPTQKQVWSFTKGWREVGSQVSEADHGGISRRKTACQAVWWTTTKTRGAGRWRRCTRHGPCLARRFRHR